MLPQCIQLHGQILVLSLQLAIGYSQTLFKISKTTCRALLLLLQCSDAAAASAGDARPWMNKADPPEVRAKKLVAEMKMEEKLVMLHGPIAPMPCCECFNKTTGKIVDKACAYTGNVVPNDRLGIPPIHMNGQPSQTSSAPLRSIRQT